MNIIEAWKIATLEDKITIKLPDTMYHFSRKRFLTLSEFIVYHLFAYLSNEECDNLLFSNDWKIFREESKNECNLDKDGGFLIHEKFMNEKILKEFLKNSIYTSRKECEEKDHEDYAIKTDLNKYADDYVVKVGGMDKLAIFDKDGTYCIVEVDESLVAEKIEETKEYETTSGGWGVVNEFRMLFAEWLLSIALKVMPASTAMVELSLFIVHYLTKMDTLRMKSKNVPT